jgi:hypothetical protein
MIQSGSSSAHEIGSILMVIVQIEQQMLDYGEGSNNKVSEIGW